MIEYLNRLEERITKLTGLHASLKEEKETIARENAELKNRLVELERENHSLRESQAQVRERVDTLIKRIEGLEVK